VAVRQLQLSLPYDHLVELSKSLLALVPLELAPELELLVDDLEGLVIIAGQLDLLPELVGQMGSFDRLHVEVALALVLAHGGVPAVTEGATVAIAHSGEVEFVPAESLRDGFGFKSTVAVVDDVPHYVVLDH